MYSSCEWRKKWDEQNGRNYNRDVNRGYWVTCVWQRWLLQWWNNSTYRKLLTLVQGWIPGSTEIDFRQQQWVRALPLHQQSQSLGLESEWSPVDTTYSQRSNSDCKGVVELPSHFRCQAFVTVITLHCWHYSWRCEKILFWRELTECTTTPFSFAFIGLDSLPEMKKYLHLRTCGFINGAHMYMLRLACPLVQLRITLKCRDECPGLENMLHTW